MQFNYSALDSYEFELLSRDVAEKLMHIKLSCYTEGRDGGIDASDFLFLWFSCLSIGCRSSQALDSACALFQAWINFISFD